MRCSFIPPRVYEKKASAAAAGQATRAYDALHAARDAAVVRRRNQLARGDEAGGAADITAVLRREVRDARNGTAQQCPVLAREGDALPLDPAVRDVYANVGVVWQFFQDLFDRNSIDDRGMTVVSIVHYDRELGDAYWDTGAMLFGDGNDVARGFTAALDVIGHELTHGVTQFSLPMTYEGQSGALNEHLSDVFGTLVRQRAHGMTGTEDDWLIGRGVLVGEKALRSMEHPGTAWSFDDQPADMSAYAAADPDDDFGGVHRFSGIPNRAFCLYAKAVGGNPWEIPARVWYAVVTGGTLGADATFAQFRDATVAAALQAAPETVAALENAWTAVGVQGA